MIKFRAYEMIYGGKRMRFRAILFSTLLILSACSTSDSTVEESSTKSNEEETESVEQETETDPEEQKLLDNLPAEADLEDWNLILVNPWEALPANFEPELVEVDNEQEIDARIEDNWKDLKEAASEAGYNLFLASGYRSVERQESNFNQTIQENMDEGLTEEEATEKAKEYLTEPGYSEHHTGLALDIVGDEWIMEGNGLVPEYDTQDSQEWLMEHMTDYGFILRYPENKEDLTGILYESWHFRYVGKENAEFITENDLALEEYIELLEKQEELAENNE